MELVEILGDTRYYMCPVLHVPAPARHEVAAVARAAASRAGVGAGGGRGDLGGLRRGVERGGGRHAVPVERQRDRVGQAEVLAVQVAERTAQPGGQEVGQVVAEGRDGRG